MKYPEYVSLVIDRLEENGFESYIVGGSVRDMIIGKEPHDFDVATAAPPETVLKIFSDMRTVPTGLKHGTVTVISRGENVEITTFRIDGDYIDSRHPESVDFTNNINEDLSRRDFTVNAMAYSVKNGLVDPFGGREDIERKLIRAVGDPEKRFSEDALRIMRAFRFSAKLGFEIDENTLLAAKKLRFKLTDIARERITYEFLNLICSKEPLSALEKMIEADTLRFVLGEYVPSQKILSVLAASSACERVRLGILMSECDEGNRRKILSSLKLSGKLTSNTLTIAARLNSVFSGDDVDARRFIGSCGELTLDVLDAARAVGVLEDEFECRVKENLSKKVCTSNSGLAINGSHLVKLGFEGKDVGSVLAYLLERVIEAPENNNEAELTELAKNYKEQKTKMII